MLQTLIQLISRLSTVIYIVCGVGIFFSIRGLFLARRSKRLALFGLEREAALRRQRNSLTTIIILTVLAAFVWVNRNILEPNALGLTLAEQPTPTSEIFIQQSPSPTVALLLFPTITPTSSFTENTDAATPDPSVDGCQIFGQTITFPLPDQEVSGQVPVEGTVNLLGLTQYKFEINGPSTQGDWAVVNTFNRNTGTEGFLGNWDSTSLIPGDYQFRLVSIVADGRRVTPCEVPIVIAGAEPEPESAPESPEEAPAEPTAPSEQEIPVPEDTIPGETTNSAASTS